ncbi:MAG: hypothetical protein JSS91_10170 [Bacteroidetes bacterium]|nr:hypothetical protein [Bacteroidota bacterium]
MKFVFLILFIALISQKISFGQEDYLIFEKEIKANGQSIRLTCSSSGFFTGSISVYDRNNNRKFFIDSIYTRYISDTLLDLDNSGTEELILDLGTGINAYDYNMLLIFDFKKSEKPLYEVHNAEIISGLDEVPKIVSHVRFSPLYLGTGYDYSLRYTGKGLVLETDPDSSKVLKSLDINEESITETMNAFKEELDECDENNNFISYFEQYLMQKKLLKKDKEGWDFFNRYYNCRNKKATGKELKEFVSDLHRYLMTMDYKFGEE